MARRSGIHFICVESDDEALYVFISVCFKLVFIKIFELLQPNNCRTGSSSWISRGFSPPLSTRDMCTDDKRYYLLHLSSWLGEYTIFINSEPTLEDILKWNHFALDDFVLSKMTSMSRFSNYFLICNLVILIVALFLCGLKSFSTSIHFCVVVRLLSNGGKKKNVRSTLIIHIVYRVAKVHLSQVGNQFL